MKIPDFRTEQWMTEYEGRAVYNLTDTCVSPLSLKELIKMDHDHLLDDVKLDYGCISGNPLLKRSILSLYQTGTEDNITMMHGCSQANEQIMLEFIEAGDTVITFVPGYEQFINLPKSIGAQVITVPLIEENGWQPDRPLFREAMQKRVKMILLNNPNNPTGTLLSDDFVSEMIALAKEQGTYILIDEVYRSPQETSLSDLYDRAIATGSLSKLYSLAGLRLGWIKSGLDVIARMNRRRDYSLISTGDLMDRLAIVALSNREELLARSRDMIARNQQVIREWLKKEKRCSLVMPKAGTVGFLQYDLPIPSKDLCIDLLEKTGVFFVPGWCFDCEYHLRIGFTQDPAIIAKGLQLFSAYLNTRDI